jgi:hypothetical protein
VPVCFSLVSAFRVLSEIKKNLRDQQTRNVPITLILLILVGHGPGNLRLAYTDPPLTLIPPERGHPTLIARPL